MGEDLIHLRVENSSTGFVLEHALDLSLVTLQADLVVAQEGWVRGLAAVKAWLRSLLRWFGVLQHENKNSN